MDELLNKKILIVDDELDLLRMIEDILFSEGFFNICTATDCKKALLIAKSQTISLFVLDINLPDGNGFMLYNELREISQAPVIFLTARGEPDDRIRGLGLGADDYITKPFLPKELVLRIRALLRRAYPSNETETKFMIGKKTIDIANAQVISDTSVLSLTAKEVILIKKLWENKNRIVTNDALCIAAWGEDYYGHENSLMVHIRHLREKIENEPSSPKNIITVKGLGYKLVTDNE
jgi:DNA-binding response OmpR family regulator